MKPSEIQERFPVTAALAAVPDGETFTWGDPTTTLEAALESERERGAPSIDEARRMGVPVRIRDGD